MNQYIVGHRGAAGLAPENTIKAFRLGCEKGVDVIECDIHLSKDKQLVVFHDNTLNRTTNGQGWIKNYTLEQLKQLDAGDGEKIPTLEEVIAVAEEFNRKLIIEIKGEDWETTYKTTDALINFLSQHKEQFPHFIIHSFWHESVKKVKQTYPDILTAVIMMIGLPSKQMLQLILDANANGASIDYDYISKELITLTKENNLFLDAWVLNDESTFIRMKNMGVNGLITNYPGKFSL